MTTDELVAALRKIGDDYILDDALHEAARVEVDFINGTDFEDQVHYLTTRQGWSHDDILAWATSRL